MKKIILTIMFALTFIVIGSLEVEDISAMTFYDSYAGQVCVLRGSYDSNDDPIVDIDNDDDFGTPVRVSYEESSETVKLIKRNPAVGSSTYYYLPKYEIQIFEYPIMLDTLAGQVTQNATSYNFSTFSPEIVLAGQSWTETWNVNASHTISEEGRTLLSMDYAYESGLSVGIPIQGVTLGASVSSSLAAHIETEFGYSNSTTMTIQKSGTYEVDNTPGSSYYQNGDKIYVSFGTRAIYNLKVVVITEILYEQSMYYSGSWPFRTKNYTYTDDWADYATNQVDYEFHSTYNALHNPFAYTWDYIDKEYELVSQFREPYRVYVN